MNTDVNTDGDINNGDAINDIKDDNDNDDKDNEALSFINFQVYIDNGDAIDDIKDDNDADDYEALTFIKKEKMFFNKYFLPPSECFF